MINRFHPDPALVFLNQPELKREKTSPGVGSRNAHASKIAKHGAAIFRVCTEPFIGSLPRALHENPHLDVRKARIVFPHLFHMPM
jgi:hypothetical protein